MDRQYIIENDVVEKYLMGRLSVQDKQAYEDWLEKNPQGKAELEEERLLLSGIRQINREDMKAEIRRQTEAARAAQAMRSQQSDFNWGMMMRVAAILLIVIAAPSLYYFSQANSPEAQSTGAFDTEAEGLMPALAEDEFVETDAVQPERMEASEMTAEKPVARRSRAAKKKEVAAAPAPPAPMEEDVSAVGERRQDAVADLGSSIASGSSSTREGLTDKLQSDAPEVADDDFAVLRDQPKPAVRINENQDLEVTEQLAKPSVSSSIAEKVLPKKFAAAQETTVFRYSPERGRLLEEKYDANMLQNRMQYRSNDDRFKVPAFLFSSGEESILVQYKLEENLNMSSRYKSGFSGFKVFLAGREEDKLRMSWHVDEAFFDIPLEQIKLIRIADELLEVIVDDSLHYEIDLKSDTTRAVRLNK